MERSIIIADAEKTNGFIMVKVHEYNFIYFWFMYLRFW
jgi:hypothetical protein